MSFLHFFKLIYLYFHIYVPRSAVSHEVLLLFGNKKIKCYEILNTKFVVEEILYGLQFKITIL